MTKHLVFLQYLRKSFRTRAAQEVACNTLRDLAIAGAVGACFLLFYSQADLGGRHLASAIILAVASLVASVCSALLRGGPKT